MFTEHLWLVQSLHLPLRLERRLLFPRRAPFESYNPSIICIRGVKDLALRALPLLDLFPNPKWSCWAE